jgi:hypothetical protein
VRRDLPGTKTPGQRLPGAGSTGQHNSELLRAHRTEVLAPFRGGIRRPMGDPPGPTACTRRTRRTAASQEGSQRTTKAKRYHSLPFLIYSRLGGLRQDPGRAAESTAGPRTDQERPTTDQERTKAWGHDVRVLLSTYEGRGDEPPVIRSASAVRPSAVRPSAVQRSTATWEVPR